MRTLLFILIGITIVFNADTRTGFIYLNNSPDNITIIVMPSQGKVEWLRVDQRLTETVTDWVNRFLKSNPKGIDDPIATIEPVEKQGIQY